MQCGIVYFCFVLLQIFVLTLPEMKLQWTRVTLSFLNHNESRIKYSFKWPKPLWKVFGFELYLSNSPPHLEMYWTAITENTLQPYCYAILLSKSYHSGQISFIKVDDGGLGSPIGSTDHFKVYCMIQRGLRVSDFFSCERLLCHVKRREDATY